MSSRAAATRLLSVLSSCTSSANCTQARSYKVVVVNGNVAKAVRNLNAHIREEKLSDQWKACKHYVKPSHQRVAQQKATQQRLNKEKFKTMMYWVMQAKSRGF